MAATDVTRPADGAERISVSVPQPGTLALAGALTFHTAAQALAAGSRALAADGVTRLDLADLTRADSAGLACVLALAERASAAGRSLEVLNWPAGLRSLAEVCGAQGLFDVAA